MEQSVFEKYAMAYVECVDSYEKSIEELETLISALKAEKEFESVLASPKISKSNKKKMLWNILNQFNDDSLIKFSNVIIDNSRERFVKYTKKLLIIYMIKLELNVAIYFLLQNFQTEKLQILN